MMFKAVWTLRFIRALAVWRRRGGFLSPLLTGVSGGLIVLLSPPGAPPQPLPEMATVVLEIIFYGSIALGLFWCLLRARLSTPSMVFWLVFLSLSVLYACGTKVYTRSYDWNGHDDYIHFILDRHQLPKPQDCWVCYHPPLYYLVAAPFYRVFRATPFSAPADELQLFSIGLFGIFLIYFLKLMERLLDSGPTRVLTMLSLAALPATMIHSARIGNDALLYIFWMGAVFHLTRWETEFARRDMTIASVFLALGFVTKGTAPVPVAAMGVTVAVAFWRSPQRRKEIKTQAARAITTIVAGSAAYLYWSRRYILHAISPNASYLGKELTIHQTAFDQVAFNVRAFVMEFAEPRSSLGAREHFLNFFLKSSAFGEWLHPFAGARSTMRLFSLYYLAVIVMFVGLLARSLRRERRLPVAMTATVLISPLFSLAYRWQGNYICMGDARYVYPMFAVGAIACVWLLEEFDSPGKILIYKTGVGILVAFIAAGVAFQTALFISLF